MDALTEFRMLNELVKAGQATDAQTARWQALKADLIGALREATPPHGTPAPR